MRTVNTTVRLHYADFVAEGGQQKAAQVQPPAPPCLEQAILLLRYRHESVGLLDEMQELGPESSVVIADVVSHCSDN